MISGEYKALSRFERRAARIRSYLLGRTALCGALTIGAAAGLGPRDAKAGPQGTVVVGGSVDISRTGTHTEFTQHTQTALLNHNSFDIQQNESVNFAQPNASAIAINRIVGSNLPTEIAGKLTANGNVWVLNPSGVAIHGTAQVNVGGLIATTASISDEDAMAGRARFSGAPAGSAVTNAGTIDAQKGSVVLVAPVVRNTGTITAHGSDVALGAGSGFTVDFEGDGLTRFEVAPGDGVSLTNTGSLSAEGGAAYISADSAGDVQSAVVSIGGTVEATRIEKKGGVIYISGGDHGVTEVSGTLDASQAGGDGGTVVVTGDKVDLKSTAVIDASGAADGGTVLIGGDLHGAPIASEVLARAGAPETAPLPTARRTVVRDGARIVADAGLAGDGGKVVVWSDEATGFRGAIEAKGGETAGDGGFAEVSGKVNLAFDGQVDLSAPSGETGTLLLDPQDIHIVTNGSNEDEQLDADEPNDGDPANEILFDDATASDFTITAGAISDADSNVLLQATQDIDLERNASIDAEVDLTFEAGRDIVLGSNADITTTGDLTLSADADFSSSGGAASDGDGTITFGNGNSSLSADDIVLRTGEAVVLGATTAAGDFSLASNGTISQLSGTALVVAGTTGLDAGAGDITLGEDLNSFAGDISASGTDILLDGVNRIVLADIDATGTLDVEAGNDIVDSGTTIAGKGISVAGTTTLRPGSGDVIALDDDVNDFGDTITVVGTPDAVTINDANTLIAGVISADSGITLGAATTVDITGALTAPNVTIRNTSGGGIGLGATAEDGFQVDDVELDLIAGNAIFAANGRILVDGVSAAQDVTLDSAAGGVLFDGADSSFDGALTIDSDGTVGQLSAGITVSGATDINANGSPINLSNPSNDFESSVELAGASASLDDKNALEFGEVSVGDLTVNAYGGITQSGAVTVTGSANITAPSSDIVLENAGNDFKGAIHADAENISLVDANSITVDNVTAGGSLTVTALGGAIDDGSPVGLVGISVTGTTALTATGGVTLDDANNDFGGAVDASSGGSLDLVDANDITLRDVSAVDAVSVAATEIDIVAGLAGVTSLDGGVTLVNSGGDATGVGGAETAVAGEFRISQTDLDRIDANSLEIRSGGGAIGVDGADASQIGLLTLDAGAGAVAFNNAGSEFDNLTVTNTSTITQGGLGTVAVTGDARFVASGDVALGLENDFSTSTVHVDVDGNVTLNDVSAIGLGAFDVGGNLTVTAGGTITDTDGEQISVTGTTSLLAESGGDFFDIALDNRDDSAPGEDIALLTGAVTAAGEDITIFNGQALTLGGIAANGGDATVDGADNAGDLTLSALGSITATGITPVSVDGATSLLAQDGAAMFDILIDSVTNDFVGAIDATGDDITLIDANAVRLGDVDADTLSVTALSGTITQTGDGVTVTRFSTLSAGTDVLLSETINDFGRAVGAVGGNVALGDANAIELGGVNASGDLSVTAAAGAITQNGDGVTVTGTSSLSAADDVMLLDSGNNFGGAVDATGADVTLVDTNAISLGAVDANSLSVTAGGSITDTTGEAITVSGTTSLFAGDGGTEFFDIALDNIDTHDFSDFGAGLAAEGEGILVKDIDGIGLGNITAHDDPSTDPTPGAVDGGLALEADGDIVQAVGSAILAPGSSVIDAGGSAITLDQAGNDFADAGGAALLLLSAAGDIEVSDADSLALGMVDGASLSVSATDVSIGLASPSPSASVNVTGTVAFTNSAGDTMILGAAAADGSGTTFEVTDFELFNIHAADLALITAGNGGARIEVQGATLAAPLTLDAGVGGVSFTTATTSVAGDLSVTAGAAIIQDSVGSLSVTGTTDILAEHPTAGFVDVALGNAGNDFGGKVSARGGDIALADANGITLGQVTAGGNLAVTAGGSIGEDGDGAAPGDDVRVGGLASLTAGADIVMTDAFNDFGTVDASGDNITLNDADNIALGQVTAGGDLAVTAGGAITDVAGKRIAVAGSTGLLAAKGGDFFDIVLDNSGPGDVHDFAGADDGVIQHPFSAVGEDIAVNDIDALLVGTLVTHAGDATVDPTIAGNDGSLTAHAGGTLSLATLAPVTVDIAGDADLTAESFTTPGEFADIVFVASGPVTVGGAFSASGEDIVLENGAASPQEIGTVIAHDDGVPDFSVLLGSGPFLTRVDGFFNLVSAAGANDGAAGAITANGLSLYGSESATFTFDNAGNTIRQLRTDQTAGVTIRNSGAITLDSIGATDPVGSLMVETDGEITQIGRIRAVDVDLTAANAARTDFFDIRLDATVNLITGTIAASGADIALSNAAAGGTSLGDIATHATPGGITVTGDDGDLDIVSTGGAIRDASGKALNVTGATSLLAADGGDSFDILLDNADAHHLAGPIDASGEDISIANAAAATRLGTLTTHDDSAGIVDTTIDNGNDGDLTVASTGGAILDTSGRAITVRGTTSLVAAGEGDVFDIRLDGDDADATDRPHDFSAANPFDASGEDILVTDANGIRLGAVMPHDNSGATADPTIGDGDNGDLTVEAGGAISDTPGSAITVPGETALTAKDSFGNFYDIALDEIATHDFRGAVSAVGEDIVLDDASAIILGAIDSNESGTDDNTVAFFDDNGDGVANAADGVASAGDLSVRASGTITDTSAPISVDGRTRLEARNGATLFDITLDTPGAHDFDANAALAGSAAGDAADEVDATGATITLVDRDAIALGGIDAAGDLAVTAGGSITDTPGKAIIVDGTAIVTAVDSPEAPHDFFDIALDNIATHDFNIVTLSGEGIELADADNMTVTSATAHGDGSPDPTLGGGSVDLTAGGRLTFTEIAAPQGSITLETGENFAVAAPPGSTPLDASGDIELTAPAGSFFEPGSGPQSLGDGLTFSSAHGDITLDFGHGFVVADRTGTEPFTLDAPTGTSTLRIGTGSGSEFLGFGTADFLSKARSPGFNPLLVAASIGDAELFHVTGNLSVVSEGSLTLRSQNTSSVSSEGKGVVVDKVTFLGGSFAAITIYGSFNESGGNIAALQGFKDGGGFSLDDSNTANACVILLPSSCQPLGTVTPTLDFPDGLLLGIRFVDPRQDLDDPFTNRGDEEEWE